MARGGDEVVDVLGGAVAVVAGQDGLDGVNAFGVGGDFGAELVAAGVVASGVVGVPEVDGGAFDELAFAVDDAAGDEQREAGFAGLAEGALVGRPFAKEGAEDVGGGGCGGLLFGLFPGGYG